MVDFRRFPNPPSRLRPIYQYSKYRHLPPMIQVIRQLPPAVFVKNFWRLGATSPMRFAHLDDNCAMRSRHIPFVPILND